MVAFTFGGACGWDCLVDSLQTFGAQSIHDHTTNDGRQHFRVGSRDPSRYEARRSEVSGNDFPLLLGVTSTDAVRFSFVAFLLCAIVLVACFIPARRAMQVDPMVALHYE
jgi:hypothetical protein